MADSTSPTAARCPRCEAELREGAVLCAVCGYHLKDLNAASSDPYAGRARPRKRRRSQSPTPSANASPLVLLRSLFTTDGRISRSQWWTVELVWLGVCVALGGLMELAFIIEVMAVIFFWGGGGLAFIAQIKRWHDRGKPGNWCLISFIPVIGWLWVVIELGFLRGTEGPNGYGNDPTASSRAR